MPKEKYEPGSVDEIERQHFSTPHEQEELGVETEDALNMAIIEVIAGRAITEYAQLKDTIISVTVRNALGETIFFSKEPDDIKQFMDKGIM